jgi:hypothetical protein
MILFAVCEAAWLCTRNNTPHRLFMTSDRWPRTNLLFAATPVQKDVVYYV